MASLKWHGYGEHSVKKEKERGSVIIMIVLCMVGMLLTFALAIEFGVAWSKHAAYDNDLVIAKQATQEAGFGMQLKNSDEPHKLLAVKLAETLKQNGYKGDIKVRFYEADEAHLGPELQARGISNDEKNRRRVRVMAYQITISEPYKPMTGLGEANTAFTISNGTETCLVPYGLHQTYHPPKDGSYKVGTFYEITFGKAADGSVDPSNPIITSTSTDFLSDSEVSVGKLKQIDGLKAAMNEGYDRAAYILSTNPR